MSVGMSRRVSHMNLPGCRLNSSLLIRQRKESTRIDSRVTAVWLLAVSAGPDGLVGRMNGTRQDKFPLASTPLSHSSYSLQSYIGYTDVNRSEFRILQSPSVLRSTLLSSSFIYYRSIKYVFVVESEVITAVTMTNIVL